MESEYLVDDAASRVDSKTPQLEGLDIAIKYNYALWLVHYSGHMSFLEGLHNLGDIWDMSDAEVAKYAPEVDLYAQCSSEIGDISPQDYVENGVYDRLVTQFMWGTKYNPPFVHSSDALSGVAATLGKLGK
jgi:hypothetical protein